MRNKKPALWRGLTSVFCIILALSLILGSVLEANAGTIDTYLGTLSSRTVSENPEDLYTKYKPIDDVLNEDGTGNSTALIQAAIDLGRREAAEGAVLLKNNGALPLSEGDNITMLGIRSHMNLLGSSFGVKAQGVYISLEQALSQNVTDFAHTIAQSAGSAYSAGGPTISGWSGQEFEFDGAGLNLNQTMIDIYENLNTNVYKHIENEGAAEVYNPGEPSLNEIAGVNPNYKDSFAEYGDAAIVVIGRASCESVDYMPGGVAEGLGFEHGEPLSLTQNELDAIELAKEASDKVIVLIASSSSVEIGTLKNDPEVDAIMWIGAVGCYGNLGIADLLVGKVSPSGGLFDIFTAYNMSAPAMQNFGRLYYANSSEVTRSGGVMGFTPGAYAIEAEGIYVGYRYYETRYYDAVAGVHNASSAKGAYATSDAWSYADEVTYGFGYGLSYTTFDFDMGEPVWEREIAEDGTPNVYVTFPVTVTNTGKVAGKTPVQIYGQAPYYEGGVEKSAIQLLNFEKSSVIEPGQSEVVNVKVDMQYIASYDMEYKNADGTQGTYILDPGDYYFAVGNGAHDALNNIMVAQGMDETLMVGTGDETAVHMENITENFISKTAFSISKTGYQISNQIPYSDWNYYQPGEVTYLSRADWEATWPKQYHNMTITSTELFDHLNGKYYTLQTGDDTSSVTWGVDHGIHITDMYGVAYDDPKWDEFLEQLTLEEAMYIFSFGGPSIPGAESIGAVETYMTENAGNGVAVALNASKDPDAPWAITAADPNGNWHPEVFGSAPLGASTFNPELMYELGAFTGLESLFTGINILWGPGLNTHRHAYNGRNGEYYSEDPILSGVAAMEFAIGASEYGLIAAPKHFAFNDQETDRGGVSPWMTEQRAREVELRAYQYAFEATKYDTEAYNAGMRGLMTSFSKIGGVECTCSYGLMTEILANEWGFIGYAVTDIYDDTDLWASVLNSGTTCFDTRGQSGFYSTTTLSSCFLFTNQINEGTGLNSNFINGDVNLQAKLKEAVHKNIFAWSESHLMNRYAGETHIEQLMPWWRTTYYAAIGISAILMVLSAVMYVMGSKKEKVAPAGKAVTIVNILAAVLGIVGVVATYVCSTISTDNAMVSLTSCLVAGIVGVVLAVVGGIMASKNDLVRTICSLGSIATYMFVLSNLISERVMLVAGLFSYNAGNTVGWQVFYVTIVAGVAMLLASIVVIIGSFMKGAKKADVAA
ncbi:MAG: glycoside hydrolase family 3 C-terminal domain-containing protein [Oscillospiraceae bacterium]|nr:glycoside hydrolase family 3 C-terminal domain-containing protein [Oscillospiraceae bacterium]